MGRTSTKAFDHVETFEDLTNTIFGMIIDYPHANYMDEQSLEVAVQSFAQMNEQQQKYLLKFVRQVDRRLSFAGSARGNVFHKLPTILAGCIYIANHEETTKDLSLDELIVLSRFSIVEPPGFYEGAVDYLGKDLLTAVTKKHFDYTYQSAFLDYAESRIREGHTKEETAAYIRDVTLEQLKEETFEYERKLLEEVGHYLWK